MDVNRPYLVANRNSIAPLTRCHIMHMSKSATTKQTIYISHHYDNFKYRFPLEKYLAILSNCIEVHSSVMREEEEKPPTHEKQNHYLLQNMYEMSLHQSSFIVFDKFVDFNQ